METKQNVEVRVDKWLWAARFFKTRSLAQTALENGRVLIGGARVKRSRLVQIGDEILIRIGEVERTVIVQAISPQRGGAKVAQLLYSETPVSIRQREQRKANRKLFADPAAAIAAGRPTKRDRRRILQIQGHEPSAADQPAPEQNIGGS